MTSTQTWLVIGAGPSGLAVAANLRRRGLSFVVAEATEEVGGIWNVGSANSPAYSSLHFISSKKLSAFTDFPMPEDYPDYPSAIQIRDYLRAYAKHHELYSSIRFNTAVDRLEPLTAGGFSVRFSEGAVEQFAGVIVATGHLRQPNLVEFPGTFSGEMFHSFEYRNSSRLQGKRVLVVGVGNSGCDIAVDSSHVADKTFISARSGVWFVPKYILGKPADEFAEDGPRLPRSIEQRVVVPIFERIAKWLAGDPVRFGLPKPKHRILDQIPVVNTQLLYMLGHGRISPKGNVSALDGDRVVFADGSSEQVDAIVLATGYNVHFGFCDSALLGPKSPSELALNILHPTNPDILVAGLTEGIGSAYPTFNNVGRFIAECVSRHADPIRREDLRKRAVAAEAALPKMNDSQGLLVDLPAYNKALEALVA
jgi:cation diffusion facilitator CzcD-associated flavoprotein CzcO